MRNFQTYKEVVYVAGTSLEKAIESYENNGRFTADTPQEAYDKVGYFDAEEETYEVYRVETNTTVIQVIPPYTR